MPPLTSDSSQNPTCYFYFCCIIPEVHSARLESSMCKSLELENNLTHTHVHMPAHTHAGGKVTAGHGGTRILPTPGKTRRVLRRGRTETCHVADMAAITSH